MNMSKKWTLGVLLTTAVIGPMACSEAAPEGQAGRRSASALDGLTTPSRSALPACDDATQYGVAYLTDEKVLVVCNDGTWQEVELKSATPGPRGPAGAQGKAGPQGEHGRAGAVGAAGAAGPIGPVGQQGETGAAGEKGATGDRGAQGETGAQGAQGQTGAQGAQGQTGAQGAQGETGAQGAAGLNSLITMSEEPSGSNCPTGGKKIDVGVDANRNGVLDPSEIAQTAYVCGVPVKRVIFISSVTYTGDLGGATGADARCQQLADASEYAGKTFKAWISDASSSPSTRFTKNGEFVRPDGTLVATSWADLTDGSIAVPINVNEHRTVVAAQWVFSGTKENGTVVDEANVTCNNWTTSVRDGALFGHVGYSGYTNSWSDLGGGNYCDMPHRIYCVQQ
ncbi:MAG: DUF1554 domain-containing protein [Labilithrix sp.]|nr:DUF1554 domain-containing protein [Labilithrix sp.]